MSIQFISVVREGLSRDLTIKDSFIDRGGDDTALDAVTLESALELTVSATLGTRQSGDVKLRMIGLGEVAGIADSLVLGTHPRRDAQRVDTSLFPVVEFDAPALPWMFTPLKADGDRLRPWIALVVVPFEEESPLDLSPLSRNEPAVLTVDRKEDLPPIGDTWAWAHAQLVTDDTSAAADIDRIVAQDAKGTSSRLMCPRRLEPDRHYVACVVPTFEAARAALLDEGEDDPRATTLTPTWGRPETRFPLRLPALFSWEFFTGEAGSFETVVSRLRGTDAPAQAGRTVDASKPGPDAVEDLNAAALPLAGALRPRPLQVDLYTGPAASGYRQLARTGAVVTSAAGRSYPVVDLPLYAGRHVGVTKLADATRPAPPWVDELNTDPRHRAAAALGAAIVRKNQEDLMRSAWEQAGDVEEANRRLRRARLGRAASRRIVARHLEPLDAVERLRLLAPSFGRLGLPATDQTVAGMVDRSRLPNRVLAPSFTSLTRPNGRIGRQFRRQDLSVPEVAIGLDDGSIVIDRGDLARPGGLVTLEGVLGVVVAARDSARESGDRTAVTIEGLAPTEPGRVRAEVAATTEGRRTTRVRIIDRAGALGGGSTTLHGEFALAAATTMRRIDPSRLTSERVRELPGKVELIVGTSTVDVTEAHREAMAELFSVIEPVTTEPAPALNVATVSSQAFTAVEPGLTIARAVLSRLDLPNAPGATDPLEDVLAAPQFPSPLAPELIRIAPDLVLPGLDEVPADRVFAVVSNPPFVQAVLAGANHEVMRELRWRGYPTDERGTAFHRFWRDDADEIGDLHTILTGHLGDAVSGGVAGVVVVVRSEVLTRFQGTLVYAVPAVAAGAGWKPDFSSIEVPIFFGTLAPDVSYFGFTFTERTATGPPGRYLAFQEPVTSPRFGLDTSSSVAAFPAKASELAWTNVPLIGDFVSAAHPGTGSAFADRSATWGSTAADQAASTYQQPVRAAVHFRDLMRTT